MSSDSERAAILRRRNRFIGSALLAVTGCGAGNPDPQPVTPSPVLVPEPTEGSRASESVPPRAGEERPDPMPSLEVPADAIGVALEMYEALARQVPPIHGAIDRLPAETPSSCGLSNRACEKAWRVFAARLEDIAGDIAALRPVCPGSSDEARRYERRVREHQKFALARLAAAEREIEARLGEHGEAWRALRDGSERAEPMVCLDCSDW